MNTNQIVEYREKFRLNIKTAAAILAAFIIAVVSFTTAAEHFSDPETYETTIESLDEKRNDVLAMSASSASISTALTLLPNDIASPIADNLADLSTTLMIVLCAIFLEKYMLTLAGLITFKFLIPAACLLFILFVIRRRAGFFRAAMRIAILGVCIVALVPASTWATGFIEDTYSVSIEENVAAAEEAAQVIEENKDKDESFLEKLFSGVKESADGMYDKVKNVLSNFIEAAAILIITSCIIPILTLWLMIWATNTILGINIEVPKSRLGAFAGSGSGIRRKLRKTAAGRKDAV